MFLKPTNNSKEWPRKLKISDKYLLPNFLKNEKCFVCVTVGVKVCQMLFFLFYWI